MDINKNGEIAGYYFDSNGSYHGFVRSPGGDYTTFDDPSAGAGSGQGTYPAVLTGLTDTGAVAGTYVDLSGVYHGYLRSPSGIFTTIDPSDSTSTIVTGLSSKETVAGFYLDSSGHFHGFLRTLDGTFASYDAPNPYATLASNISPRGLIAGYYLDDNVVFNAYVRSPNATLFEFSVPDGLLQGGQGTIAADMNSTGRVTGYYIDFFDISYGFLLE